MSVESVGIAYRDRCYDCSFRSNLSFPAIAYRAIRLTQSLDLQHFTLE